MKINLPKKYFIEIGQAKRQKRMTTKRQMKLIQSMLPALAVVATIAMVCQSLKEMVIDANSFLYGVTFMIFIWFAYWMGKGAQDEKE